MKTPFTPYFKRANVRLIQVDGRPFVPSYPMPFIAAESTAYYVGDGCQLIYRWHDAFDVFVAVLEAYFPVALDSTRMEIPIESHLSDLHLVYQLRGTSHFIPPPTSLIDTPLVLSGDHRMEVYAPPSGAKLYLHPDAHSKRFVVAVVVPKGDWVTRHPVDGHHPMDELLLMLRQQYSNYRYLEPGPIISTMRVWLHLLFTLPAYPGMFMDHALNDIVVHLLTTHRSEHARQMRDGRIPEVLESARLLAQKLVSRMDGSEPPPMIEKIANKLQTTSRRLRQLHLWHYKKRFVHHIYACRMEEAKRRLERGFPIAAVAYQLGWTEHPNFTNQFRRYTGISPSEYRRQHCGR